MEDTMIVSIEINIIASRQNKDINKWLYWIDKEMIDKI